MTIKRTLLVLAILLISVVLVTVIRLVLLKKDVSDYEAYWQQRAEQPVADNALIYVALGDSAAQGIGASQPENSYVQLVADHLALKSKRPVHIINLSVSGAKVQDILSDQLSRYKELGILPDVMTVEIGANDLLTYDQDKFTSQFKALLDALPDSTYVANVPSFKNSRLHRLADTSATASTVVDELLKEYPKLKRADLQNKTSNLGVRDFAADWFHPSNRAYKKMGERIH